MDILRVRAISAILTGAVYLSIAGCAGIASEIGDGRIEHETFLNSEDSHKRDLDALRPLLAEAEKNGFASGPVGDMSYMVVKEKELGFIAEGKPLQPGGLSSMFEIMKQADGSLKIVKSQYLREPTEAEKKERAIIEDYAYVLAEQGFIGRSADSTAYLVGDHMLAGSRVGCIVTVKVYNRQREVEREERVNICKDRKQPQQETQKMQQADILRNIQPDMPAGKIAQ